MRKATEYDQHADECRAMATKIQNPTHKKQLEEMAEAWAMLAREHRKQLAKSPNGHPHPLELLHPEK